MSRVRKINYEEVESKLAKEMMLCSYYMYMKRNEKSKLKLTVTQELFVASVLLYGRNNYLFQLSNLVEPWMGKMFLRYVKVLVTQKVEKAGYASYLNTKTKNGSLNVWYTLKEEGRVEAEKIAQMLRLPGTINKKQILLNGK
jgi:hypothetical protein